MFWQQPACLPPCMCSSTRRHAVVSPFGLVSLCMQRPRQHAGCVSLCCCAGLSRSQSSLFDGRVECWLEMVSTNILGTAMMTRAALQDMQRRGSWGHIINMGVCAPSSLLGFGCGVSSSALPDCVACAGTIPCAGAACGHRSAFVCCVSVTAHIVVLLFTCVPAVGLSGHRIPDAAAGGTFFAATKFAVRALTEGLRQEVRQLLVCAWPSHSRRVMGTDAPPPPPPHTHNCCFAVTASAGAGSGQGPAAESQRHLTWPGRDQLFQSARFWRRGGGKGGR